MEEGSGSNDHIDQPKAFFIFHNIPHVLPDYWAIPPMSENPVEHLASTYRHVVDALFSSLMSFLGRLGGLYINLGSRGYLQIRSPRVFWDADSFPEMLREILSERRVPQESDASIIWHTTNLQSLFDRFPECRRVIGCLLNDQREINSQGIGIHDLFQRLHPSQNLVFVIGDFRNYELEDQIDHLVKVSDDPGTPTNICVEYICQECQRKWKLM